MRKDLAVCKIKTKYARRHRLKAGNYSTQFGKGLETSYFHILHMTPVHFDVGFFDSPILLLWSATPKKMKEFYSIVVYLSLLILPNTRRTSGSNVEETSERYKIDGKITIQGFKSSGTSWTLLIWKYVKSASVSQNSWFFESHILSFTPVVSLAGMHDARIFLADINTMVI